MRALIGMSPYRQDLLPMAAQVAALAYDNHQVRVALHAVWLRVGQGAPNRRALGAEARVLTMFLEHVRYASPAFLASVGEGTRTTGAIHG